MTVLLWHIQKEGPAKAVACQLLQGELTRPLLADHVRLSQCTGCNTAACPSVCWSVTLTLALPPSQHPAAWLVGMLQGMLLQHSCQASSCDSDKPSVLI